MSDVKKIATRETYGKTLVELGAEMPNLVVLDADLAAAGMVPFASTFAMFAAGRAFEQVRNSIGYPHLNVKIGATHAGISVGEDGASHQCLEDLALMRTIPGMVVMCPAVAECLAEKCQTKMYRIGVRDKFGESGSAGELLHKYML